MKTITRSSAIKSAINNGGSKIILLVGYIAFSSHSRFRNTFLDPFTFSCNSFSKCFSLSWSIYLGGSK